MKVIKYDSFLQSYTPQGIVTYTSGKARNEMFESSEFIAEMKEAGMGLKLDTQRIYQYR